MAEMTKENKSTLIIFLSAFTFVVLVALGMWWYKKSKATATSTAVKKTTTTGANSSASATGVLGSLLGSGGVSGFVNAIKGLTGSSTPSGSGSGGSGGSKGGGSSTSGGGGGGGPTGGGGGSNSSSSNSTAATGEDAYANQAIVKEDGTVVDAQGNQIGTDDGNGTTYTGTNGETYSLNGDTVQSTPDVADAVDISGDNDFDTFFDEQDDDDES